MNLPQAAPGARLTIERLRLWVAAIIVIGALGTITELLFLGHYEEPLQFVPLILLALTVISVPWYGASKNAISLHTLQTVMALSVLSSILGVTAHFQGSAEFQLDINPKLTFWQLFLKVAHSQAPPLLAPGMMLQLGLLGLAYAFTDNHYRRSPSQ